MDIYCCVRHYINKRISLLSFILIKCSRMVMDLKLGHVYWIIHGQGGDFKPVPFHLSALRTPQCFIV